MSTEPKSICVVGLGYVGLPLAVEFGKTMPTVGFDISEHKVRSCIAGIDPSRELTDDEMAAAKFVRYTSDPKSIGESDYVIVAVPTPIDEANSPDLTPLVSAARSVGRHMKPGTTVIFESTVYPGATEEVCIPMLEQESGLRWKSDFWVGYSPERINPGDKERTLTRILKVVSGDTDTTAERVAALYESIIVPGVFRARSIKVAEAAKVIENTQRDLNIALVNELAMIFAKLGIDSSDVLEAAGTKWNFLKFRPGLVGGHCIGVDPYYLTHKAETIGYHPQVILAGRRINDGMAKFVAEQTVKVMTSIGKPIVGSRVLVLGLTFKENCGDLRNSKVADVIRELASYNMDVIVTDPLAHPEEAESEYGVHLVPWDEVANVDAIVAAVPHDQFVSMKPEELLEKFAGPGVFVDVKSAFDANVFSSAGHAVWRL